MRIFNREALFSDWAANEFANTIRRNSIRHFENMVLGAYLVLQIHTTRCLNSLQNTIRDLGLDTSLTILLFSKKRTFGFKYKKEIMAKPSTGYRFYNFIKLNKLHYAESIPLLEAIRSFPVLGALYNRISNEDGWLWNWMEEMAEAWMYGDPGIILKGFAEAAKTKSVFTVQDSQFNFDGFYHSTRLLNNRKQQFVVNKETALREWKA
jgi:hypothetical protein